MNRSSEFFIGIIWIFMCYISYTSGVFLQKQYQLHEINAIKCPDVNLQIATSVIDLKAQTLTCIYVKSIYGKATTIKTYKL